MLSGSHLSYLLFSPAVRPLYAEQQVSSQTLRFAMCRSVPDSLRRGPVPRGFLPQGGSSGKLSPDPGCGLYCDPAFQGSSTKIGPETFSILSARALCFFTLIFCWLRGRGRGKEGGSVDWFGSGKKWRNESQSKRNRREVALKYVQLPRIDRRCSGLGINPLSK